MTNTEYKHIENHMLSCMDDAAHDRLHVYRVLFVALDIARFEPAVDTDILIAACLLHDIGRARQFKDPSLDHASEGADMAQAFLLTLGWSPIRARRVADCVRAHRFRTDNRPETIEAKILFDADKIEATGALAAVRTIQYGSSVNDEPLYRVTSDGRVLDGTGDEEPSFFTEYHFKLLKIYDGFYTSRGRDIASQRKAALVAFHDSLLDEIKSAHDTGRALLDGLLDD